MNFKLITTAFLCASISSVAFAAQENKADLKQARTIVKAYAGQLKPELKKAIKAGGPAHAVAFCHSAAPKIAMDLAKKTGWTVKRVSLKHRGAMAKPDAWETKVLEQFEMLKKDGKPVKKMEFSEVVHDGDKNTFRYMKPLQTAEVCLKCHGTNVSEPVKQAIAKYYPDDKAMGYKKGDIRGAFSFSKEVN